MSAPRLSRRDVLKLGLAALTALASDMLPFPDDGGYQAQGVGLGRVTVERIGLYKAPSFRSPRLAYLYQDMLLHLQEELISPYGPPSNPRWYRVAEGYVHSAYIQRVDVRYNPVRTDIPETGRAAEVTVPYTRAYRPREQGWQKLYRLYYSSVHWVVGLCTGPDGKPWYRIFDDWMKVHYCAPAHHLRLIEPHELAPISPDVPAYEKFIWVDLDNQRLTAYEGDEIVLETEISTGLETLGRGEPIPTKTPVGTFHIFLKAQQRHMGDGQLTSDIHAYELPGVPWVSFFHEWGVAFHGTFWHDNFGNPMSHGCVNMRTPEALWLFRWATPVISPLHRYVEGYGTRVKVTEQKDD